jgi:hypothetical protein
MTKKKAIFISFPCNEKEERKKEKEPMKTHPPSIFLYKNCFAPIAELINGHIGCTELPLKKTWIWVCRTNSKLAAKNCIKNLVLGSRNMSKISCIKLPQNVVMSYKINDQTGNIKLHKRLHYGLSS